MVHFEMFLYKTSDCDGGQMDRHTSHHAALQSETIVSWYKSIDKRHHNHGGTAAWATWEMAHAKFWLDGPQCIWPHQQLACMFVSSSSVELVKKQIYVAITASCGFCDKLPADGTAAWASCGLSPIPMLWLIGHRSQIWPTQKYWRGAPYADNHHH